MSENAPVDAGHLSFLELIKVLANLAGPAFTMGALVKTGLAAAAMVKPHEFPDWEAFLASVEVVGNPITQFEGKAKHYGQGLLGLPACPFAGSIKTYKGFVGGLPAGYAAVTENLNKPSEVTQKLRVAHGAGVSPFCCVHQPIRSALGNRIKVGGKLLRVYQLGCKSGTGHKGIAEHWLKETAIEREVVDKILDENMCCYCIRFEE